MKLFQKSLFFLVLLNFTIIHLACFKPQYVGVYVNGYASITIKADSTFEYIYNPGGLGMVEKTFGKWEIINSKLIKIESSINLQAMTISVLESSTPERSGIVIKSLGNLDGYGDHLKMTFWKNSDHAYPIKKHIPFEITTLPDSISITGEISKDICCPKQFTFKTVWYKVKDKNSTALFIYFPAGEYGVGDPFFKDTLQISRNRVKWLSNERMNTMKAMKRYKGVQTQKGAIGPNNIIGRWCSASPASDYPHLTFQQDGYVVIDCRIDTVFSLNYMLDRNQLVMIPPKESVYKNTILKFTKDSLILETLLAYRTKQVYYRCNEK